MPKGLSRRSFLRGMVGSAAALAVAAGRGAAATAPPAETGLASEGLLAGVPGFQPRTVAPLPHDEIPGFLSRAQLAGHHAEYARAVDALRATEASLATADRGPASLRAYGELRRAQVRAANDVLLHELYFRNLAKGPVAFPRYLEGHVREHMGSRERWASDFTACALVAEAWAALVYDPYDDRWHNVVMGDATDGVWIGANPLVVCDVAPHAFEHDYRSKEEYVARFLEHVQWGEVAGRYRQADRM